MDHKCEHEACWCYSEPPRVVTELEKLSEIDNQVHKLAKEFHKLKQMVHKIREDRKKE